MPESHYMYSQTVTAESDSRAQLVTEGQTTRSRLDHNIGNYTRLFNAPEASTEQKEAIWDLCRRQSIIIQTLPDHFTLADDANLADVWMAIDATLADTTPARHELIDTMNHLMANSPLHSHFEITNSFDQEGYQYAQDVEFHVKDTRGNGLGIYLANDDPTVPSYIHFSGEDYDPHFTLTEAITGLKASYRKGEDNLVIYTKDNCMQCKMTQRQLDKAGVPYLIADIQDDPQTLSEFKAMGIQAAPVVERIGKETYGGLRPDKIREIVNTLGPVTTPNITTTTPSTQITTGKTAPTQSRPVTRS